MKSKKATKRALLSSALSLVLCFSMLLGTTFAWFTDTASTGVNMIQSGTLDVELMNEDGSASLKGQSLQFVKADGGDEVLWEPGVTFRTEGFQIVNLGNLALKYKVVINGISDGSYAELLDVIDFYVTTDKDDGDAAKRISLDDLASNYTPLAPKGETLAKIETDKDGDNVKDLFENVNATDGPFYLFGHMDEDAGNEYQDKQLTGLGITVYATQVEAEFDSFDNVYDEDAAPNMVPVAKVERILEPVTVTSVTSNVPRTLDTAYTFSTMETYDAAQLSPYAEWNADFVITFDKDVAAGTAGLAGQYDFFSYDWLAFEIPEDITAGVPVRLLEYAGIGMTYEELCLLVKEFDCGAFDVDNQNAGTTMTVELRLFETQKAATGSGTAAPGGETGNYKTIATYSYTFPVKTAEGLKNALAKGGEIELAADIDMEGTQIAIPAGVDAVLNLNGHDLTGTYTGADHYAMFKIPTGASLTINGEGDVTATTVAAENNRSLALFQNSGELELNGGNYKLTDNSEGKTWIIATIVDNRTSDASCVTKLTINGGDYSVAGKAINLFRNYPQQGGTATLIINDGTFYGEAGETTYIWNQEAGSHLGELYFNGGTYDAGVVYEDYNGQSDIHIAAGVTIQGYSGNT